MLQEQLTLLIVFLGFFFPEVKKLKKIIALHLNRVLTSYSLPRAYLCFLCNKSTEVLEGVLQYAGDGVAIASVFLGELNMKCSTPLKSRFELVH